MRSVLNKKTSFKIQVISVLLLLLELGRSYPQNSDIVFKKTKNLLDSSNVVLNEMEKDLQEGGSNCTTVNYEVCVDSYARLLENYYSFYQYCSMQHSVYSTELKEAQIQGVKRNVVLVLITTVVSSLLTLMITSK